jgi:hypothetical protein
MKAAFRRIFKSSKDKVGVADQHNSSKANNGSGSHSLELDAADKAGTGSPARRIKW